MPDAGPAAPSRSGWAGTFTDGPVGLGHTRLSIIDVEGGTQPMSNEDASVWITCNGKSSTSWNFVTSCAGAAIKCRPVRIPK